MNPFQFAVIDLDLLKYAKYLERTTDQSKIWSMQRFRKPE